MDPESPDEINLPLSQRDTSVLNLIGEEGLTSFAFEGLKRRLGMHSETLSRVLARLAEEGIVEKGLDCYRLTPKAEKLLRMRPFSAGGQSVPLLQTILPPDLPPEQIVADLAGKWFGVLRWMGISENPEGIILKWITEDGGAQIDARFSGGALYLEAKLLSKEEFNKALIASYQIIGYISRLYLKPSQAKPAGYLSSFCSYLSS